jgi:hypothetical protein
MMKKFKSAYSHFKKRDYNRIVNALFWLFPRWLVSYCRSYLMMTNEPKLISREFKTYFKKFIDLNDLAILDGFGMPGDLVKSRINRGDQGVIIGHGDEVRSILWGASGKKFLKVVGAILDPGQEGFIAYGGYTKEKYRIQGLIPSLFKDLYQYYSNNGIKRVYASVDSVNHVSLNFHQKMNFKIVGETFYFVLLGVSICYYKKWPYKTRKIHIFFKRPPENLDWV